ncbi:hsp-3 [Symbiodinium natans]|uniref:Hsp-3 protein n=1 Tax=Symbiodinium natans TaxID=878477 RepID=A0A812K9U8_9DINO|nr:hsp-3 [Symbiodinium natans]
MATVRTVVVFAAVHLATGEQAAVDGPVPLIGEAAKDHGVLFPAQTMSNVKRLMGRDYKDAGVQRDSKMMLFKVVADSDGSAAVSVTVNGKEKVLKPEEIAALLLRELKERAEKYLGRAVKHAVVSVPAFFNDRQRKAVKSAASLAGLEILQIINEPTAAAVAYGFDKKEEEVILVYDLGGGTCDVSVLKGGPSVLQVLATSGDPRLGGEDFDRRVMKHLIDSFKKKSSKDISSDAQLLEVLHVEVEKAKRKLSTVPQASVTVNVGGTPLTETLTRAQFEKLNDELFRRTLEPVQSALKDAGLHKSEVTTVILAGGSSRIPKVQQMLSQFFDGKELTRRINPDEVVAHGAAIQAASMSSEENLEYGGLIDVIPLSLGIQTAGGFMTTVLQRNMQLPAEHSMLFSTHKDNQEVATVKVFQGERLMARNNHFLGSFQIKGIPAAPRGVPQIQVLFKVDESGLLTVEASDRDSGKRSELAIDQDRFPSGDQVQEMLNEAEAFVKDDQREFARAEARMALKSLVRSLHSAAESAPEEDAGIFLEAAAEGQDWLAANPDAEAEEIHEKREELEANVPELPTKPVPTGSGESGGELDMEGHDEL